MNSPVPPPLPLTAPVSPAAAHAALALAMRAEGPLRVRLPALDLAARSTLFALSTMGAEVFRDGGDVLFGPRSGLRAPFGAVHCGRSLPTTCLAVALASTLRTPVRLFSAAAVPPSALRPLLVALEARGAKLRLSGGPGALRLWVQGPLRPGVVVLGDTARPVHAEALLLALAHLDADTMLSVPRGARPPWTASVARALGLPWTEDDDGTRTTWLVPGGARPVGAVAELPADPALAAPLLVAAALGQRAVALQGLGEEPGALALCDRLRRFGLRVEKRDSVTTLEPGPLRSVGELDLWDHPELLPALAVLAAFAPGPTVLQTWLHPRLEPLREALGAVGLGASLGADGLHLRDKRGLHGQVRLQAGEDPALHRALRLLALRLPELEVLGACGTGENIALDDALDQIRLSASAPPGARASG